MFIHDVNYESASQVTKAIPSLSTLYFICLPFIMFLFIFFLGRNLHINFNVSIKY
jgi:hypothetical protein